MTQPSVTTLKDLVEQQDAENAAYREQFGDATHSHPDDVPGISVHVKCSTCEAEQAFTVPADLGQPGTHNLPPELALRPIVWECNEGGGDDVHVNQLLLTGPQTGMDAMTTASPDTSAEGPTDAVTVTSGEKAGATEQRG